MNIKLLLVSILVLVALLYWILPRTALGRKFKMNIRVFYLLNVIGIVFGALGIVASLTMGELILERHYFELILLPILLIFVYTAMIMKGGKNKEIYDEKQNLNMTQAAAATWPASIILVFVFHAFYQEGVISGLLFYPLFLFATFCFYSVSVLYFFRRN